MRFLRTRKTEHGAGVFVFQLSLRDRNLLLSVLKLFPATDASSHRLSRNSSGESRAGEDLLVETMAEQRRSHAEKIEGLFKNPRRYFRDTGDGLEMILNGEQIEWLLQALNDVRVGSWMRLGCPEMEAARRAVLTEETATHYTAMEVSGYFQSALLDAFQSPKPAP